MEAEDFIKLIEQRRFDKISKNGMILIAERFRELQKQQLILPDVMLSSPTDEDCRNVMSKQIEDGGFKIINTS